MAPEIVPSSSWILVGFVSAEPQLELLDELSVLLLLFFSAMGAAYEVPWQGVEWELQLPAYATATRDPSRICNLHHSSQQRRILNSLSEARDRTCHLMVTSRIRFHCTTKGSPDFILQHYLILVHIPIFPIFP